MTEDRPFLTPEEVAQRKRERWILDDPVSENDSPINRKKVLEWFTRIRPLKGLDIVTWSSDDRSMNMRKVVLTVECSTVLTHEELTNLQSLVFGCVRRKDMHDRESRTTIKRVMPKWLGHDVRGVIEQVSVNVIKEKPAKKSKPAAMARKRKSKR